MQTWKNSKNNNHIFKANIYLSIIQLFFLLSFISNITAIFLYPNNHLGFTSNVDKWFEENWTIGSTNSFQELLDENGWIIIYQSLIVIALWSFIFFS